MQRIVGQNSQKSILQNVTRYRRTSWYFWHTALHILSKSFFFMVLWVLEHRASLWKARELNMMYYWLLFTPFLSRKHPVWSGCTSWTAHQKCEYLLVTSVLDLALWSSTNVLLTPKSRHGGEPIMMFQFEANCSFNIAPSFSFFKSTWNLTNH